jgi:DNA repair exonuclease SbcCD ATPase subunit
MPKNHMPPATDADLDEDVDAPEPEADEELSIEDAIADLKAEQTRLLELEGRYTAEKEKVADLWKQYWPAAEAKKALKEELKAARAAVRAKLDKHKGLKALVASLDS